MTQNMGNSTRAASNPINKYQYADLSSPQSIRLLEIISHTKGSGEFECKIHTTDLENPDHPSYWALSYTWGLYDIPDDTFERPNSPAIVVDGQRLAIGVNLFDFLEQSTLLPGDPDCKLGWIDAICINQENLAERSVQVAFMRDIYERAHGVVVWLGRHDTHSRRAMPLIASFADIDPSIFDTDDSIHGRPLVDPDFYEHNCVKPLTVDDWEVIQSFFSRPWFRRLWTVQELVVAKTAILLCGETIMNWEDMQTFIATVMARGWELSLQQEQFAKSLTRGSALGCDMILRIAAVHSVRFVSNPTDPDISQLLRHLYNYKDVNTFITAKFAWIVQLGRYRTVTDPRDKIFAPLGLALGNYNPEDCHPLKIDYSSTTRDVFTLATHYIIRSLENLSIISCGGGKARQALLDLPSWVPNFNQISYPPSLLQAGDYNAHRGVEDLLSRCENHLLPFKVEGSSLFIFGVKVDVVDVVSGSCEELLLRYKVSSIIETAARAPVLYRNGESRGEVMMKALVAGTSKVGSFLESHAPPALESLQIPFRDFVKCYLAFEIWNWSKSGNGSKCWWDDHRDIEDFLDRGLLLPSRSEMDEYLPFFMSFFPASQDFKTKPLIDDPEFMMNIWEPHVPYTTVMSRVICAKCLCISEKKYVGIAPSSSRRGDEIWIVHGSKTPYVLRKRSDGVYEFIGEAYIHGLMHGEFFEGRNDLKIEQAILEKNT